MGGVWLWLRSDRRARWRSTLAVAALLAVTGGSVLALLAGARRTEFSLDRLDRASREATFVDAQGTDPGPLRALADHPEVEALGEVAFMAAFPAAIPEDQGYFPLLASVDGVAGRDVLRGLLVRGRHPDPMDPHEVALAETTARRLGADVGTRIPFTSLAPEQWSAVEATGSFPDTSLGPELELRVVGVVRTGFDLGQRLEDPNPTLLTPAFFEAYRDRMGVDRGLFLLRLKGGLEAAPRFGRVLESAYQGRAAPVVDSNDPIEGPRGSIRVVSAGLVAVAVAAALAGLGWLAVALHRHATGSAADLAVLAALGLGRRAQLALIVGAAAPGVAAGTAGGVLAAVVASPLLPVGLARRADPDVGFHADLLVLAPGGVALVLVAAGFATLVALRVRQVRLADHRSALAVRGAGLAERGGARLGPVATAGLAFALPPRGGAPATPVRPALIGAVAGLAGVVAVGVIGASMGRLVDTPARYGSAWDVAVPAERVSPAAVTSNPDVEAAAVGLFQRAATISGKSVFAYGMVPVKGRLQPPIVMGREPSGPDEVALGKDTLDRARLAVGGAVAIATPEHPPAEFRIVGQAVFLSAADPVPVADGALLTHAGLARLGLGEDPSPEGRGSSTLVIRWRSGVDGKTALARLGDLGEEASFPLPGVEVARLGEVERFPQALAAFLAAVSVIAVAHGLMATVRRRSRDLAVLGALGLTPGQRRGVVGWHAAVLAGVGLALGVPLGIAVGRWVWVAMAGDLGVATDAAVPVEALGLTVGGTVVLFGLLAAWSGRAAVRLRPAQVLRAE